MSTGLIITDDTGWVTPQLTHQFQLYDSSSYVRYRRIGDVVNISGQITPTQTITASNSLYTIFTLPDECSAKYMIPFVCQGSSQYLWTCIVDSYGYVAFYRYRRGSSAADCPAGTWLPFDCSFIVWGRDAQ